MPSIATTPKKSTPVRCSGSEILELMLHGESVTFDEAELRRHFTEFHTLTPVRDEEHSLQ